MWKYQYYSAQEAVLPDPMQTGMGQNQIKSEGRLRKIINLFTIFLVTNVSFYGIYEITSKDHHLRPCRGPIWYCRRQKWEKTKDKT